MLDAYPRVYFACHTRHVADPVSGDPVSAHQASILDHLDEVDAMSVTDLAGHMGVTVATMSLAIDRLERRAYVRRERDPRDRRRVLLRVTPAGVRLREAKSVLDPVRVEQVLGHLSPADRDTFNTTSKGTRMINNAWIKALRRLDVDTPNAANKHPR